MDEQSDKIALLTLELSTESIETIEQAPAYSFANFLGDIGGNVGIFFSSSILKYVLKEDLKLILQIFINILDYWEANFEPRSWFLRLFWCSLLFPGQS